MPKLKLKRTPQEERDHYLRKARKNAKRAARNDAPKSSNSNDFVFDFTDHDLPSTSQSIDPEWDAEHPIPGPSTLSDADYARLLREMEERKWQDKLADAMDTGYEEDRWARMDSVEASMNDYVHVPNRWRTGSRRYEEAPDVMREGEVDDMDDEGYAEWVRRGMWKKTHAAEVEAEERRHAAREERKRIEKENKSRAWKLERQENLERERRRLEEGLRCAEAARLVYEQRWKKLISQREGPDEQELSFVEVPWPVLPSSAKQGVVLDDLLPEAIERFVVPPTPPGEDAQKLRKDRLRKTMLRFHPDKFEARVLRYVRERDREVVKEGVGKVVRAITQLSQAQGSS